jgi:hypothetical protein
MRRRVLAAGLVLAAPAAAAAQTPWALLARRVVGRVEHMQQMQPGQDVGADVASVVVQVPAERVYERVLATVRATPGVRLLGEDAANARLEVSRGGRVATVAVVPLGDGMSQLSVVSTFQRGEAAEASQVVAHILAVCSELGVACSAR